MEAIFEHGLIKIAEILDARVEAGESLYVTLLADNVHSVMTFGSDNWRHLNQASRELVGAEQEDDGTASYVVIVRRFDEVAAPGEIPQKTIAGYVVRRDGVLPLSSQEIQDASETDHQSGKKFRTESKVDYVDGLVLLPELEQFTLKPRVQASNENGRRLH